MSRNSTAPGKASTNLAETTIVGGAVGLVRSAVKEPKVVCKLVILNSHVFHQWRLLLGCALCHDWMSWFVSGGSKKFWQCNSSTSRISKMVSRMVSKNDTLRRPWPLPQRSCRNARNAYLFSGATLLLSTMPSGPDPINHLGSHRFICPARP